MEEVDMRPEESWLLNEVNEHLEDYGMIGLYELIWLLNGSAFPGSRSSYDAIAHSVAAAVLRSRDISIRRLKWPTMDVDHVPLDESVLSNAGSWEIGRDGTYVAFLTPDF
ncbi:hypothetical protein ACIBO5_56490 [Nonomuraea angiospora]|uniref:hypothetical protein n=1 Tax=Nonomuraea angiospora TaxID=46172 RepID=UPI003796F2E6